MKKVTYTGDAAKDLKRHNNVATKLRQHITDYAADPLAHANNLKSIVGATAKRLRVGGYRIIFDETDTEITVTKIGPRGDVYDD